MQLGTRTLYGTGAMIELALAYGQGRLSTQTIAGRQMAPPKYLEQVLADLRRSGLITSARGVNGGHALAFGPAEITMQQVYEALEGTGGLLGSRQRLEAQRQPQLRVPANYWQSIYGALLTELSETTLAVLAEEYRNAAPPRGGMYYI